MDIEQVKAAYAAWRDARAREREARAVFDRAVVAAVRAGAGQSRIGAALGISKQAIHQILTLHGERGR